MQVRDRLCNILPRALFMHQHSKHVCIVSILLYHRCILRTCNPSGAHIIQLCTVAPQSVRGFYIHAHAIQLAHV